MERVSVAEAAELLNMPVQAVRAGLEQGVFPFGVAIKRSRWTYYIYREKLNAWLYDEYELSSNKKEDRAE